MKNYFLIIINIFFFNVVYAQTDSRVMSVKKELPSKPVVLYPTAEMISTKTDPRALRQKLVIGSGSMRKTDTANDDRLKRKQPATFKPATN